MTLLLNQSNAAKQWSVDYFMEKLLGSENFAKVTDIIARKAADIINVQLSHKTKNNYLDDDYFRAKKGGEDFDTSELNTATIKSHVSNKMPVKSKLSLKYKLFTKETKNEKEKDNIDVNLNGTKHIYDKLKLNRESLEYNNNDNKNVKATNIVEITKFVKSKVLEDDIIQTQTYNHSKNIGNKSKMTNKSNMKSENPKTINLKNNNAVVKQKKTDRIFVLQTSSDYEEYHKEINKAQNKELSTENV